MLATFLPARNSMVRKFNDIEAKLEADLINTQVAADDALVSINSEALPALRELLSDSRYYMNQIIPA